MNLVGLDLGTSSVKVLLTNPAGTLWALAQREYPLINPKPGYAEIEPQLFLRSAKEALSEIAPKLAKNVPTAIALSSQAQALTPVNAAGCPLYNIIVTMDSRTVPQFEWWKNTCDEPELYARTGAPFSPIYAVNKIMWHKENNPRLYDTAKKICCVQDLVLFMLCGEFVMDYSLAGRTMMFNPVEKRWDERVLSLAGIDAEKLSRPVPSSQIVGMLLPALAAELGFPANTKVIAGGHDQCCGALGAGVISPGTAMNALGTVDALVSISGEFSLGESMMRAGLPCYNYIVGTGFISMAINTNNGLLTKWFHDMFFGEQNERTGPGDFSAMFGMASHSFADAFILPHLQGANSPEQNAYSCGAIVGLRSDTGKSELVRAMMDSLTYEMKINVNAMEEGGHCIAEIRAVGGGAKSADWLQIKADIFQKPVVSLRVNEGAALGAALLAGIGAGAFTPEEGVENLVRVERKFLPNLAVAKEVEDRFAEYRQLYHRLKPVNYGISKRVRSRNP